MTEPTTPSLSILKRAEPHSTALHWNGQRGGLWWLNPEKHTLTTWDPASGNRIRAPLPDAGYTFCPTACGRVLIGLSKRLCLADIPERSGARLSIVNWLATVDALDYRTAIGNGRADRHGRFVFGTRNMSADGHAIGSFYQYCAEAGLRRLALPTVVAAGCICLDLAGTRLYFADTAGAVLYRCNYDSATATTSGVIAFAQAAHGASMRDALVDGDDGIWTAQPGASGATVVRYTGDGAVDRTVAAPRNTVAGICAYGEGLRQLLLWGDNGGLRLIDDLVLSGLEEALFDDRSVAIATAPAFAPD